MSDNEKVASAPMAAEEGITVPRNAFSMALFHAERHADSTAGKIRELERERNVAMKLLFEKQAALDKEMSEHAFAMRAVRDLRAAIGIKEPPA